MSGAVPALHVVTDDEVLARPGFPETAMRVLEAGGGALALHVRGPRSHGAALYSVAVALAPVARRSGALLVVNDRLDVALCAGAGAVHLGRRSLPAPEARRIAGDRLRVGVSTHSDAEVEEAAAGGADWIFVGTIHPSGSHPGAPARGAGAVTSAAGISAVPVLAIGGIRPEHVGPLREAGAHGVAVVRGVWDAPAPEEALSRYLVASREVR